jgi:hypothetical protein
MELFGLTVNPWAILLSAIASFAIGFPWYAVIFKKMWVEGHAFTQDQMQRLSQNGYGSMIFGIIGYLITATVLSLIFSFAHISDMGTALTVTFGLWLGFTAVMTFMNALYAGKSLVVTSIDTAYELVYSLVMAAIIIWMR